MKDPALVAVALLVVHAACGSNDGASTSADMAAPATQGPSSDEAVSTDVPSEPDTSAASATDLSTAVAGLSWPNEQ